MGFLLSILIGALAGFIAGKLTRGAGFGFWLNLIIGIIGGFLGGLVAKLIGFSAETLLAQLILAVVGSILLLVIVGKIKN